MRIQPGVGYTFDSSDKGFTLDTSDPFPNPDKQTTSHPFKVINIQYDSAGTAWLYTDVHTITIREKMFLWTQQL